MLIMLYFYFQKLIDGVTDPLKNLSQELKAIRNQVRVTHEIGCHEFPPLSRIHCLDEDMDTTIGQGYS